MTRSGLRERFSEVVAAGLLGGASKKDVEQAFEEALAGFSERTQK
jgi:hypothetical protein